MPWLIGCRALQGIGGGGLTQLSLITISDVVPLKEYAYKDQKGLFLDPTDDLVAEGVTLAYLAPRMALRGSPFAGFELRIR